MKFDAHLTKECTVSSLLLSVSVFMYTSF